MMPSSQNIMPESVEPIITERIRDHDNVLSYKNGVTSLVRILRISIASFHDPIGMLNVTRRMVYAILRHTIG